MSVVCLFMFRAFNFIGAGPVNPFAFEMMQLIQIYNTCEYTQVAINLLLRLLFKTSTSAVYISNKRALTV